MSTKALRAPSWLGLVAVAVAGARAECHQHRLHLEQLGARCGDPQCRQRHLLLVRQTAQRRVSSSPVAEDTMVSTSEALRTAW